MKDNKIPVSQEIKKHLLTGISWMIPLIVAAGICIALGQVLGGTSPAHRKTPTSVQPPQVLRSSKPSAVLPLTL